MFTVTALKPQKNKKKVNVYLNGEFAFAINLDNLVKFKLKVKNKYTDEDINKIIHEVNLSDICNKLIKFAVLRPRSEQEISNWLKRKKVSQKTSQELFNKLKRLGLLNDKNFAKWWIEQRVQFKAKSKKEIKYELMQKGINKNIIEESLHDFNVDEFVLAKKVLTKYKYNNSPQKSFAYLARKGFDFETIKKVIKDKKQFED